MSAPLPSPIADAVTVLSLTKRPHPAFSVKLDPVHVSGSSCWTHALASLGFHQRIAQCSAWVFAFVRPGATFVSNGIAGTARPLPLQPL